TAIVFGIGVLAIAGFPGFSGFFSKDESLVSALASEVPGHMELFWVGLVTAGLTAFYMFRLYFKTFFGRCRAPADVREHIRDPNGWVIRPLYALAFFSVFAGFVGLPQVWGDVIGIENSNSLHHFLAPSLAALELHHLEHSTEYAMAAGAVSASIVGGVLAWFLYVRRPQLPGKIAHSLANLHRLLVNKYYVDELYDAVIVKPLVKVSDRVLYRAVDAGVIDGIGVNGTARAVRALAADALKYAQSGLVQSYLFLMVVGAVAIVGYLLR
ncbi:MAG: proton-conducting transporter membrane subunit, partial [Planctomycetota bacterium]